MDSACGVTLGTHFLGVKAGDPGLYGDCWDSLRAVPQSAGRDHAEHQPCALFAEALL